MSDTDLTTGKDEASPSAPREGGEDVPRDGELASELKPTAWRVLVSPWVDMFRPSRCGTILVSRPWIGILATILTSIAIGAVAIMIAVYSDTQARDWSRGYNKNFVDRSFAESFERMGTRRYPAIVMAAGVLLYAAGIGFPGFAVLALGALPLIHRSGSALRSWGRAFLAIRGATGLACVLTGLLGFAIVTIDHAADRAQAMDAASEEALRYVEMGFIACIFLGIGAALYWMALATFAVRRTEALPETPPTCEGCGYDLSYRPESGRCTECGGPIDVSLDPGVRRVGIAWEKAGGVRGWIRGNTEVIWRPRSFYERLQMRRNEARGHGFALLNCVAIGVMTGLSITGLYFFDVGNSYPGRGISIGVIMAAAFAVVTWAVHCGIGAIAFLFAMYWRAAPVFAHISKVWQYESAFAWVVWGVFMAYTWLVVAFEASLRDFVDVFGLRWNAIEPIVVLVMIGAMVVLWLFRYRHAIVQTRWANL